MITFEMTEVHQNFVTINVSPPALQRARLAVMTSLRMALILFQGPLGAHAGALPDRIQVHRFGLALLDPARRSQGWMDVDVSTLSRLLLDGIQVKKRKVNKLSTENLQILLHVCDCGWM